MGKGDLPRRKPGPRTAEEVLGPRGTTYSLRSATGPLKALFKKKTCKVNLQAHGCKTLTGGRKNAAPARAGPRGGCLVLGRAGLGGLQPRGPPFSAAAPPPALGRPGLHLKDEPAPQCPGSRVCAGRGPAHLSCRGGRPRRPSGSSVLPRRPPGRSVQKRTLPPDWVESPIPGGAVTVSSSVTGSLEGSWAGSYPDRRWSQEVLPTGTPAPLLLSPGSGGGGGHIPASLETEGVLRALPRGHCCRSPPPPTPGSQPTDPGTGPVDGASVAGPPCVLSSGQDSRAWVGAPRAWTVDHQTRAASGQGRRQVPGPLAPRVAPAL